MKHRSPRDYRSNNYNSNNNSYLVKLFTVVSTLPKLISSLPLHTLINRDDATSNTDLKVKHESSLTNQQYWTYLLISSILVLAGGVFAGLTLGLMGQDEVYLKVISTSGDATERKNSKKVLELINRGKHWVLVTLLLSNVITNETLPIVLDRVLGGGWPAVVSSTVAIVIFGEVIPQSLCVRYGLQIGAFFTPFVLGLMYVMYPIAYPIALLLDKILGEDHGTIYKKSGLKTLVTLHRTMGVERLNNDEVTIISAVLDLKEKKVCEIMTPLQNVYTMSSNRILDEACVEELFNSGFSRIPIHLPNEPTNFIGMLLVRVLISYDPEDALPVSSFPLATLPETPPETSCLNILNYFQEGKSHMVVVSESPGDSTGAIGVLTLEDVIEELIGEEIVDESDVFIDIHKAIKRDQPGPLSKRHLTQYLHSLYTHSNRNSLDENNEHTTEVQFKPSNLASNPLETTKTFVTIKRQPQPTRANSQFNYFDDDDEVHAHDHSHKNDEVALRQVPNTNGLETPLSRAASPNYGATTNKSGKNFKPISQFRKFSISTHRDSTDLSELQNGDKDGSRTSLVINQSQESLLTDNHKSINNNGNGNGNGTNGYTSGMIESVVNVQGVNKVVIESRKDNDDDYDDDDAAQALLIHGA